MNKEDIVRAIHAKTDYNYPTINEIVDETLESIMYGMACGEKVKIFKFGTFEAKTRAERQGFNPRTKEKLIIPECRVPSFKASTTMKDRVNDR